MLKCKLMLVPLACLTSSASAAAVENLTRVKRYSSYDESYGKYTSRNLLLVLPASYFFSDEDDFAWLWVVIFVVVLLLVCMCSYQAQHEIQQEEATAAADQQGQGQTG